MEGLKRRFNVKLADGTAFKICVSWDQWPPIVFQYYPKHPGPDPGPRVFLSIDGVNQELLHNLAILDGIRELSDRLTPDISKSVREAVVQGVQKVQRQLPSHITLSE